VRSRIHYAKQALRGARDRLRAGPPAKPDEETETNHGHSTQR
jgi:hypothetical protein